ncbi:MAG TPA: hypothetical protein VGE42_02110, partial [Candidatus Dormibacteraeota bacterium]
MALALLVLAPAAADAATPPAAAITPDSGPLTWQGAFYPLAGNVTPPTGEPAKCEGDPGAIPGFNTCDVFELTVNVPAGYWST